MFPPSVATPAQVDALKDLNTLKTTGGSCIKLVICRITQAKEYMNTLITVGGCCIK